MPADLPLGRSTRSVAWLAAILGAGVAIALASILIHWVEQSPVPPFLVHGDGAVPTEPIGSPKAANRLRVAGSGSNLPLTRQLAEAFEATRPGQAVHVHESVGSTGGVRATLDQAIDIGLISRPLKPDELEQGLQVFPYARVAVVFAANPSVPIRGLTRSMVLDLYSGRLTDWDDGSPAVVLQRERGDSSHLAAHTAIAGFEAIDRAAWDERRFRVLFNDQAMQDALLATPGSIGLFDAGLATIQELQLTVLEFEAKHPDEDLVRTGSYPLYKDLGFVVLAQPDPLALDFIEFVYSPAGQRIIEAGGYVPLDPPAGWSFAQLDEAGRE